MSVLKSYEEDFSKLLQLVNSLAKYDKKHNQRYTEDTFNDFKEHIKSLNNDIDLYKMMFDFYNKSINEED